MIRASMRRAALLCAAAVPLAAQQATPSLADKLPVSQDFIVGQLPNGFRYFIKKNNLPAKRAELRLVVNAGATLEDDDQQGYAHFLEHTAFNGTTNFKKNDLMKYLETIGMRLGSDLNATTTADETIYTLSVPTDTAKHLETGFLILEDWAHGQLFDSLEVVNERGVVREEWRGRLGAGERMQRQFTPIILKGSRYAERNVIGSEESIMRAQPSALRRFYQDWYRPDLMAVIAVGDFDVATVEGLIRKHFGGLAMPRNPRPRTVATVPDNTTPLVAIASDPEVTSSSFTVGFKRPSRVVTTVGDYRSRMAINLYFSMLNARLREIAQKPDAPFLGASASLSSFFARNLNAVTFGGAVKEGGIERGIEAVLAEARRANQFGFLPSELQRTKDNALRGAQAAYDARTRVNSSGFVGQLISHFLSGSALSDAASNYELTRALMPGITLEEVNALGREWYTQHNRVALVTVPKKDGVPPPTEAQILAAIERGLNAQVTAYAENVSADPLMDVVPRPGRIVSARTIDPVGVTEWKLSNGAKVLFKSTDFRADEIIFTASSVGGTSLASDADYLSSANGTSIVTASGLGRFNAIDLGKKLTGKVASASPGISVTTEGLNGGASPKDLETMFQLIHMRFTSPRVDTTIWQTMKGSMLSSLQNRGANPTLVFNDTIAVTMAQNHFRARPPTPELVNQIDPHKALAFYKDRFSNAGDFTFVFVGNIVPDTLKMFVEKYIASLPGTGRVETFKDPGIRTPPGVVEKVVRKGTAPRASTQVFFTGPFSFTPQNRFDFSAMTTLGQMWLNDALREDMGGTYSAVFGGSPARVPRESYSISIGYSSSPENVDKLWSRTLRVIDSLKNHPAPDADLTKIKEQFTRSRETAVKTNSFWLVNIASRDNLGEDLATTLTEYDAMVKNLTSRQIQEAARKYLDTSRYARFVLLPER